jgi:hypothetical protein
MRDIYNGLSVAQSLAPAARTASANGTGVDLRGFDGAFALIETGVITDGSHTFEVQESDDNSTFTAVADADLQGSEPAVGSTDDNSVYRVGYRGTRRYLRVAVTVSGATSGGVYGAAVVRGLAHQQPV